MAGLEFQSQSGVYINYPECSLAIYGVKLEAWRR
jgi:hypothetical protein